jgi:hypothetical protein
LKPQFGQRQTACIRNISSPHRSHATASDLGVLAGGRAAGEAGRVASPPVEFATVRGFESGMRRFYFRSS